MPHPSLRIFEWCDVLICTKYLSLKFFEVILPFSHVKFKVFVYRNSRFSEGWTVPSETIVVIVNDEENETSKHLYPPCDYLPEFRTGFAWP